MKGTAFSIFSKISHNCITKAQELRTVLLCNLFLPYFLPIQFLPDNSKKTGQIHKKCGTTQLGLGCTLFFLQEEIKQGYIFYCRGNNGTETSLAYLPTAASISAKNNEPTTTTEFSAAEQAAIIETTPEPTKETEADNTLSTAAIAITTQGDSLNKANEISTEEDVQPGINRQQQEVPEILEPLVAEPTMPSPSYTPLPQPPVIEPISYSILPPPQQQQQQQQLDKGAFVFPNNLPIIAPGASSPSLQLIPPPNSPSPDVPQEPVEGQLPQSPEPATPIHPYNLYDIPISLLSLSGNSGGSNSDMATISNLANPTGSVPLDFTQFRYHVETGQLIKIGSQGPGICPKNMRFFAVPGHPKNGACDCDYYQCSRPLIYSPDKHECYWAWSQVNIKNILL